MQRFAHAMRHENWKKEKKRHKEVKHVQEVMLGMRTLDEHFYVQQVALVISWAFESFLKLYQLCAVQGEDFYEKWRTRPTYVTENSN